MCGADRLQDRNRHWAARGLPRAQHAGEHPAPGINGGVDLGRPPCPAHSQGVIVRLAVHRAGAVAAGAGGVHVGPADGGVHRHLVPHRLGSLGGDHRGCQLALQVLPDPDDLPGAEQGVDPLPEPYRSGHPGQPVLVR